VNMTVKSSRRIHLNITLLNTYPSGCIQAWLDTNKVLLIQNRYRCPRYLEDITKRQQAERCCTTRTSD